MILSKILSAQYRRAIMIGKRPTNVAMSQSTLDRLTDELGRARGRCYRVAGCHVQVQPGMTYAGGIFY